MSEIIKAVLFDFDDTLVATKGAKSAQHKLVAKEYYGKELTDDEIWRHWGKPLPELVCILYGTNNAEEALANNNSCHEDFPKRLFKETVPLLRQINSQGKPIGIVTATTRFSFEYDLNSLGIPSELIGYTQTAEDTLFHKPDPRVFEPALKWLSDQQIAAREALYVGDGLHDMTAALDAGLNFIGVETGLVKANQFFEYGVRSLPSIGGLMEHIH